MQIGRVIGNVVSTVKTGKIEGLPLMLVQHLDENFEAMPKSYVCTDTVNAKMGETVLTCSSSSSRFTDQTKGTCTDNTIVAIIDLVSMNRNDVFRKDRDENGDQA